MVDFGGVGTDSGERFDVGLKDSDVELVMVVVEPFLVAEWLEEAVFNLDVCIAGAV